MLVVLLAAMWLSLLGMGQPTPNTNVAAPSYRSLDEGTMAQYSAGWSASHSKWIGANLREDEHVVTCVLGQPILPVCVGGAVLGSDQPVSQQACPAFSCVPQSDCVLTPPDVVDYVPPVLLDTNNKDSICTPLEFNATVSTQSYGFSAGLPPHFAPQRAVSMRLVGVVRANIAGACVIVPDARLEAWQLDVEALETFDTFYPASTRTAPGTTLRDKSCRGQVQSGADGTYAFDTTLPPSYGPPRHINVMVTAAGFAPLTTRMYFTDDLRLRQLTTRLTEGLFKQSTGMDDDGTTAADVYHDSNTGQGYPGLLAKDPRVVQDLVFVTADDSTGPVVSGYFTGTFDVTLEPLRTPEQVVQAGDGETLALQNSVLATSHVPFDLDGMWTSSDGGVICVETLGHTFVAAEYPHTRRWGTVMGMLRGDTVSGVDFRAGAMSALKAGGESRAHTAMQGDETAAEWDAETALDGAVLAGPIGSADTVFSDGTATGVLLPGDAHSTAPASMTLQWSGGGYNVQWFKQPASQAAGYRYLKLTVSRETTDDAEQDVNSGGVLRINEVEIYEGVLHQIKVPRTPMDATFTCQGVECSAPTRVSCSSAQHQDHHCFKAFDGDAGAGSVWLTKSVGVRRHVIGTPQWTLLDLGADRGAFPTGLRIVCDAAHPERPLGCPMTFKLEGSHDNMRFESLFATDMYDYANEYGAVTTGSAINDVHDSLGMRFNFVWEAPRGRAHGHRCGSCDAAPLHTCAYAAYDATCSSRYCSKLGVCASVPDCPAGEYLRTPFEVPVVSERASKFECVPCPAGRYGHKAGLTSATCSGECTEGHWCGPGSVSATQNVCAPEQTAVVAAGVLGVDGRAFFCPGGSSAPIPAASGRRTVSISPTSSADAANFPAAFAHKMVSDRPCAVGHYCEAGVEKPCPVGRFGNKQGMQTALCDDACRPGDYCPEMSVQPTPCPPGHFCPDGITRMVCPPGRYGATPGLRSAACSGFCDAGYYCDAASTSKRQQKCSAGRYGATRGLRDSGCSGECLAGHFCPDVHSNLNITSEECGSAAVYCPRASPLPVTVLKGYYSVGGADERRTTEKVCDRGYFCVRGERYPCPAGTYGDTEALAYEFAPYERSDTFICSGFVRPGHYSMQNGTSMYQHKCPAGRYGRSQGLADSNCTAVCPEGHYCPVGSTLPSMCPAGTFGNVTGLTSSSCRPECEGGTCAPNLCREGFFCPEGSRSETQEPCGSAGVYCPHGSPAPVPVTAGWYSTGPNPIENDALATRTAEAECERGSYCVAGVKRGCLSGTYGLTRGLASPDCTRLCPPGHFCPEGSFNGTYRRCPAGRYGAVAGLHNSACSGICAVGYYCPEGSVSPTEVLCGLPVESQRAWRPSPSANGSDVPAAQNDAVFCPEGSALPLVALPGFHTVGYNRTTRMSQRECPVGSYCIDGIVFDCPAGRYGRSPRMQVSDCTGPCQRGHYCPAGSTSMVERPCPMGRYGSTEGLGTQACSGACSNPRECPLGSVYEGTHTTTPDW